MTEWSSETMRLQKARIMVRDLIALSGTDITRLPKRALRPYRRQMQIIFQDPFSSLDPRVPVGRIAGEPLRVHRVGRPKERHERIAALFEDTGLGDERRHNLKQSLSAQWFLFTQRDEAMVLHGVSLRRFIVQVAASVPTMQ